MLDIESEPIAGSPNTLTAALELALGREITGSQLPAEEQAEHFTLELRQATYTKLGLAHHQIVALEEMVADAPSRRPGKGALDNLITLFPSHKNGGQRWLESHTVERLYAYQLERDPNVVGYVTQVRCRRVCRQVSKGTHISNPVLDFLVFYLDRIALVECKTEERLLELAEKKKDEWRFESGRWTNTAYKNFANGLGIDLEVHATSRLFGTYLQNAELIYSELCAMDSLREDQLRRTAQGALKQEPMTIDRLSTLVPGFSIRTAARMLAERSAFGLERIISLLDTDRFLLFSNDEHCRVVHDDLWPAMLDETAELSISDRLLLASPARVTFATERWARLQAIQRGDKPRTPRMNQLWKVVSERIEQGISPIEACLSDHDKCGNRHRRLGEKQLESLDEVANRWSKGEYADRDAALSKLEELCIELGVQVPHRSTLNREIRKTSKARRTLIVDGIRQYQKDKDRADGSKSSLPSLAFGHTLIIDSSNFDQRIARNLATLFPSAVPRFYAGIDGATGYPMAHALLFGAARTDGLAILIREFVRRHGFLPKIIQLDRGPENTGGWIKGFAKHFGIELRWVPTGGSRYNGMAENVIGRVNHNVAHKGPGSTLPDQRGRATDGRLKSRKTACKAFEDIVHEFESYFYGGLADTRDKDDISPADRRDLALETIGRSNRTCVLDDSFRVATSIEIAIPKTVNAARGIRLTEGTYSGTALGKALGKGHITELRKDCIHPSVVYAKIGKNWYRAFRRDCQVLLCRRQVERLFHLLNEPTWRSERVVHNHEQKRQREQKREAEMLAALHGKESLVAPDANKVEPPDPPPRLEYPSIDWETIMACKMS